jgi:hypothetical protein
MGAGGSPGFGAEYSCVEAFSRDQSQYRVGDEGGSRQCPLEAAIE